MKHSVGIILAILASVTTGCMTQCEIDKTTAVVFPGLGVPNVVALGMPLDRIRALPDATFTSQPSSRYWCEIPLFGVSFSGFERDEEVSERIRFEVAPRSGWPQFRFSGKLSCGISFTEDEDVGRDRIVAVFGVPRMSIDGSGEVSLRASQFIHDGVAFAVIQHLQDGREYEAIHYPLQGIMFLLIDNQVTMFEVFRHEGHVSIFDSAENP